MIWTGTLKRVDLGAGAWMLETGDGEKLTLFGDVPAELKGRKVEVTGREIRDGASFVMAGPMVEVARVRALG
ncbi:MAG: hypothetical protein H6735_26150 [Alphaproteobacteria bacterium]|nr:hypothetical protein [Alphaproteobacteria bacterium]